ncbi:MAG TPA: hypothetical protein VJS12_18675, partial [Steroidobacteraceae bacterium]|nr:hypothetical protein [Steroidobacteraceae bacterium]
PVLEWTVRGKNAGAGLERREEEARKRGRIDGINGINGIEEWRDDLFPSLFRFNPVNPVNPV